MTGAGRVCWWVAIRVMRFERTAFWTQTRRSTKLSYTLLMASGCRSFAA
jgi:hypothetical protein